MSYVSFSDGESEVLLAGAERLRAARLYKQVAVSVLSGLLKPGYEHGEVTPPPLLRFADPSSYVLTAWQEFGSDDLERLHARMREMLETWLFVGEGVLQIDLGGEPREVGIDELLLNTALALGGDELRLLARLHGQCEGHLWVAGENRRWLAELIDSAVAKKIVSGDDGERSWQALASFLRARDDRTVVSSFSVSSSFPDPGFAADFCEDVTLPEDDEARDEFFDAWYERPAAETWELGLSALAAREQWFSGRYDANWTYELRPDGFDELRFDYGISGFDLLQLAAGNEVSR